MATGKLTVTVTGPTGDLGIAVVDALERSSRVGKVIGMARREFDPESQGWQKTEYRQGDVTDPESCREAVRGADVVIHLAFAIMGGGEQAREINVEGSRHLFEAAIAAGAERICYASSVAAYGFHRDNPDWLDEDVPPRGSDEFYYSAHKAEVERLLEDLLRRRRKTSAYVFRPCIVAGPKATAMFESVPYFQISDRLPEQVTRLLGAMPVLKPVVPDPGLPFQLVHEDDVASAFLAGALGKGSPGAYNLAGNGTLTMSDVARALGWYSVPAPEATVGAAAEAVTRLPDPPEWVAWVVALRRPVLMRTDRAKKELGWRPQHTSGGTLRELVDAWRAERPR
jgi:nucleoside-diphosphate-sugar epimerase